MINCQSNCADSHRHGEHRAGKVRSREIAQRLMSCRQNGVWVQILPLTPCDLESVLSLLCSVSICSGGGGGGGQGFRERLLSSPLALIFPGA